MAYSASKSALNTLTQNNATELAPHGIRMNAINMGWTYTENENALMVEKGGPNWLSEADAEMPLKRLMRPVDVACTACFLLSPAAQMMTGNVLDLHPDTALGMLSTKTMDSLDRWASCDWFLFSSRSRCQYQDRVCSFFLRAGSTWGIWAFLDRLCTDTSGANTVCVQKLSCRDFSAASFAHDFSDEGKPYISTHVCVRASTLHPVA